MIQQNLPVINTKDFRSDPWKYVSPLQKSGSIHQVLLPQSIPAWYITSYSLSKSLLSDDRVGRDLTSLERIYQQYNTSSIRGLPADNPKSGEANMMNYDEPDHMRLRKLAMKGFTPKAVNRLYDRITDITRELIAQLPSEEPCDISATFAYPLPLTMICEILGIPEGVNRENFKKWSKIILPIDPEYDKTELIWTQEAIYDVLAKIISDKRKILQSQAPQDLLDEFIMARDEKDSLNDQELVTLSIGILVAGHETTVILLLCCILRLALMDGLMDSLHAEPEKINEFIEEVLRADFPALGSTVRFIKEDFIVEGFQFKQNDLIVTSTLAANHDPEIFSDPHTFNIDREASSHLTFGHGPHFCLGAALARKEANIAISQLIEKYAQITFIPTPDKNDWKPSVGSRENVQVVLHPRK